MRRRDLFLLVAVLLPAGVLPLRADSGYVVIVNAANPVSALPTDEVSRIFLHKAQVWPNGAHMTPVDLPEDAPARDAFSRAVHGRGAAAIKAYWQRMIFSGRDLPPAEKSVAEVLNLVRADGGAIGYVPAGTALGDSIKVLRVTR
jgi:ABC-type phosphate transport system substrate-binding protein